MTFSRKSIISPADLPKVRKSGQILAEVREFVLSQIKPGVKFEELEAFAQQKIAELGAKPSFSTVDGYDWATCINKNEGCVHGIPENGVVNDGDIITVDVGVIWQEFHSDTSATVIAGRGSKSLERFLEAGRRSLQSAIFQAKAGNTVYDISKAMEDSLKDSGFHAVYQLTGHGIGKKLHLPPNIPCVADPRSKRDVLEENQLVAIEVMYAWGNPTLVLAEDEWTYETEDKSLTGMFEHTVLIGKNEPEILTLSRV